MYEEATSVRTRVTCMECGKRIAKGDNFCPAIPPLRAWDMSECYRKFRGRAGWLRPEQKGVDVRVEANIDANIGEPEQATRTCLKCGELLVGKSGRARFCGDACRMRFTRGG